MSPRDSWSVKEAKYLLFYVNEDLDLRFACMSLDKFGVLHDVPLKCCVECDNFAIF